MRIKIGKTKGRVKTSKIVFSVYYRPERRVKRFWHGGQLYHGYWGLISHWRGWSIDFLYHHMEA